MIHLSTSSKGRHKGRNYFHSKNCKGGVLWSVVSWKLGIANFTVTWAKRVFKYPFGAQFYGPVGLHPLGKTMEKQIMYINFCSFQRNYFLFGSWCDKIFNETVLHYTCFLGVTLLKYSVSEFLLSTIQSGFRNQNRDVFCAFQRLRNGFPLERIWLLSLLEMPVLIHTFNSPTKDSIFRMVFIVGFFKNFFIFFFFSFFPVSVCLLFVFLFVCLFWSILIKTDRRKTIQIRQIFL